MERIDHGSRFARRLRQDRLALNLDHDRDLDLDRKKAEGERSGFWGRFQSNGFQT